MNERVLITGSTGFIGSHAARAFEGAGCSIVPFAGDVTGVENWQNNLKGQIDLIIHLAGTRTESDRDYEINVGGVRSLAEALQKAAKKPVALIFASTQAVYFGLTPPFTEEMSVSPRIKYAQSKLEAERVVSKLGGEHNMRVVILRLSTVLGEGVMEKSRMSGPLAIWTRDAVAGKPIEVFQDGKQTRDYIHVDDVAAAMLLAAKNRDMKGIFNVGGEKEIGLLTFAEWVKKAVGSKSEIIIRGGEASMADPRALCSDTTKIREFGWKPLKSPREAIRQYAQIHCKP